MSYDPKVWERLKSERRRRPRPITEFAQAFQLQDQVRFVDDLNSRRFLLQRLVKDTREVCKSLRKQGYLKDPKRPLKTRGLGDHNKVEILRKYNLITRSTGVVVGLPTWGMHAHGSIANQCYLQGVPGASSGIDFHYDVCWMGQEPRSDQPEVINHICMVWTCWPGELRDAKPDERIEVPIKE